jgi:glycosyltransferase involved in cell wall biosynthesis
MKVAYISVYRDGTGYGNSSRDFIKCLQGQGVDVTPIWFSLNQRPYFIDSQIKEGGSLDDVDVVIQQTIPNTFVRAEGVKNIGLFYWETSSFSDSGWQYSCNLMDEIWMTTTEQIEAAVNSGVKAPIGMVTRPADFSKYIEWSGETLDLPEEIKDTYKFYTISDYSYRKNISGTVAAFLSEFTSRDNVSLVLKTYIDGKNPTESLEAVKSSIDSIKAEIKRPEKLHPKIYLITDVLSERGVSAIHNTCDCFVSASRGEGECIPAFDAAAMGKPVIATHFNGIKRMFPADYEPTVKDMISKPVFAMSKGAIVPGLYSHRGEWMEGSLSEMMFKMRKAANGDYQKIAKENIRHMHNNFSYEVVGPKLVSMLR